MSELENLKDLLKLHRLAPVPYDDRVIVMFEKLQSENATLRQQVEKGERADKIIEQILIHSQSGYSPDGMYDDIITPLLIRYAEDYYLHDKGGAK